MNIYVVVDGEYATKKIFQQWIPFVNQELKSVDYITEITNNNFIIYSSKNGYPGIWNLTDNAIIDANKYENIDRLVICIDSEDENYEQMLDKVRQRLRDKVCNAEIKIVIQHFCLETWLLGNVNLFRGKTKDNELLEYYTKFDVRINDPADLPDNKPKHKNRANFAYHYLRAGIKHTHGNRKHYNKHSPGVVQEEQFYKSVYSRFINQGHIKSFNDFLNAFL